MQFEASNVQAGTNLITGRLLNKRKWPRVSGNGFGMFGMGFEVNF